MENFLNSFIGKVLRWLLFLPVAFIVQIPVDLVLKSQSFLDPMPYSTTSLIFYAIVRGGASGYVFVFTGSTIAPGFKKTISILLAILVVITSFLTILDITHYGYKDDGVLGVLLTWENILLLIATIVGAIGAVVTVFETTEV